MKEKTCFVIMGFGEKTNYKTSQTFNLDKTYKNIIKPVFEDLGFFCFRADDRPPSGNIDKVMYSNILKADFVVADLSTLNPNALYELGIRHALKKNTTILIAEEGTEFPFDLNHNYIHKYEHLGKDIGVDESRRFKLHLTETVERLLKKPEIDSPIYTYLPTLESPSFTDQEIKDIKEEIKEEDTSVSDFMELAEEAKQRQDYKMALKYLEKAMEIYPHDNFIRQRRVLITYKWKQPNEKAALNTALDILKKELRLETTTDTETLGLAGAVYKRFYFLTKEDIYFKKSLWNYSRGFYIRQDYYNGINLSFLHFFRASQMDNKLKAFAHFGQALEIGEKVEELCKKIIALKNFKDREDKVWIYQTLAEVAYSKGDLNDESTYLNLAQINAKGNSFFKDSYDEQHKKLTKAIQKFNSKFNSK
ncbi:tetratricopeptide repeat-containing protein [Dokdonia sp.]|uniref:tetratricopeptide repeat-containing protein n=1 Tax=Dokdonia sp. TaxID=2024995 RepID=UPI0032653C34